MKKQEENNRRKIKKLTSMLAITLAVCITASLISKPYAQESGQAIEQAQGTPAETATEAPAEKPEEPAEKPEEAPAEKPEEAPAEKPEEKPAEKPEEAPAEKPEEKPAEKPEEAPAEKPEEKPAEKPEEKPAEKPEEAPAEKPEEKPAEKPEEKPAEKPEEAPAEKPEEKPAEKPEEKPAETETEETAQEEDKASQETKGLTENNIIPQTQDTENLSGIEQRAIFEMRLQVTWKEDGEQVGAPTHTEKKSVNIKVYERTGSEGDFSLKKTASASKYTGWMARVNNADRGNWYQIVPEEIAGYTIEYSGLITGESTNIFPGEYLQPIGGNAFHIIYNYTGNTEEDKQELDRIEVTEKPNNTEYEAGDVFDPAGLEVTAYYTGGKAERVLGEDEYTLSQPDMGTLGRKTVTVTYEEGGISKTATFEIEVKAKPVTLDRIEVSGTHKTEYTEGERFNPEGMVVTAYYSDGSSKVVEDYTYSPEGPLQTGNKVVTVTYEEGGIRETATVEIEVKAKPVTLDRIEVSGTHKTEYTEGERFNPEGMEVTAYYTDGSSKVVEGYTYSPEGPLQTGNKVVTVTYEEGGIRKTATVEIEVKAKPVVLERIEITANPTKTTYTEGESFDPTGIEVTARYFDGSSKTVTGYTWSPSGPLRATDDTIIISYTEGNVTRAAGITRTARISITVKPLQVLDSIEVTAKPTKTEYKTGETFRSSGLKVTAHYTGGKADAVLTEGDYKLSVPNMSTAGTKTVVITYEEGGIRKTASFEIEVTGRGQTSSGSSGQQNDKTDTNGSGKKEQKESSKSSQNAGKEAAAKETKTSPKTGDESQVKLLITGIVSVAGAMSLLALQWRKKQGKDQDEA